VRKAFAHLAQGEEGDNRRDNTSPFLEKPDEFNKGLDKFIKAL
jgi:hypothetical protein